MIRRLAPALGLMAGGSAAITIGVLAASWTTSDDPAIDLAAMAVRVTLIGLGTYAVAIGALALVGTALGWSRARWWAIRLGGARWGLAASLGAAMVAATPSVAAASATDSATPVQSLAPLGALAPEPTAEPEATLRPLPDDDRAEPTRGEAVEIASTTPDPGVGGTGVITTGGDETGAHGTTGDEAGAAESTDEWTVGQGDHLWSIAERIVIDHQPDADDADITAYWLSLIETNRERLAVPDNPDLIIPGQQLRLPPVG